jgi:hypothetical protein
MTISLAGSAVLAAAITVFALPSATASAAKAPNCQTGGRTVAASSQVRVFVTHRAAGDHASIDTWWACDVARRRLSVLDAGRTEDTGRKKGIASVAVTGRYVAYQQGTRFPGLGCDGRIVVFDALRRRVVQQTSRFSACAGPIVVTGRGDAAWISSEEMAPTAVFAVSRRHGTRQLDSSYGVDPASLRNEGVDGVSWVNGASRVFWTLR